MGLSSVHMGREGAGVTRGHIMIQNFENIEAGSRLSVYSGLSLVTENSDLIMD